MEENYEVLENKISTNKYHDKNWKKAHIEFDKMMELYIKRYAKRYENDLSPDEKAFFKKHGISTDFKNLEKNYKALNNKISMTNMTDDRKLFAELNKLQDLYLKRYYPHRYKRHKEIVRLNLKDSTLL